MRRPCVLSVTLVTLLIGCGGDDNPTVAQPAGSCCAPAGTCTITAQAACVGTWTSSGVCSPNPCPQPPAPSGSRLFLEIGPGGAVYRQDSTHCVVAEGSGAFGRGWEVYWKVRRNVTEGKAGFRVRTRAGTASEGSDFYAHDIPLEFSPGQAEFWSFEWGCPLGTTVQNDTIPEPDEQFTLVLESTTPDIGVDPRHSTITVTIVDDDDPRVDHSSFDWPVDTGLSWTYWKLRQTSYNEDNHLRCSSDTSDTRVIGDETYGDRSYHVLESSDGGWPFAVTMEGAKAWMIPPFHPDYPPPASDTIAVKVWETYPRLLFDGSQPESPCVSSFADELRSTSWVPGIQAWHDHAQCEGLTVVATPAGVFHHVIRVHYAAGRTDIAIVGYQDSGVEIEYYIADSVGVVAMIAGFNYWGPTGHGYGATTSALITTSVERSPGVR